MAYSGIVAAHKINVYFRNKNTFNDNHNFNDNLSTDLFNWDKAFILFFDMLIPFFSSLKTDLVVSMRFFLFLQ